MADCILVLGSISAIKYRVPLAVELYKMNKSSKLIMAGGRLFDEGEVKVSEAELMKEEAIRLGVREEDILIESTSQTTKENIICSLLIMDRHFKLCNIRKLILVTTTYHMRRSLAMAKTYLPQWISVIPCPADDSNTKRVNWYKNDSGSRRAMSEVIKIASYIREGSIPDFEIHK